MQNTKNSSYPYTHFAYPFSRRIPKPSEENVLACANRISDVENTLLKGNSYMASCTYDYAVVFSALELTDWEMSDNACVPMAYVNSFDPKSALYCFQKDDKIILFGYAMAEDPSTFRLSLIMLA